MFRKNKYFQDLDYLSAANANNPTMERIERLGLSDKDKGLVYLYLSQKASVDKDLQEKYRKLAEKCFEEDKKRVAHLLEIAEPKNYNI
jgi:hypothetical protein